MIRVREYAQLTTSPDTETSLDSGIISSAMFDWLLSLRQDEARRAWFSMEANNTLKLSSFVGYLESPQGEAIEVLPKTRLGSENPEAARVVLRKMLCSALHLTPKESGPAHLARMNTPIHEWLFAQFLDELKQLVARGLRFDYQRIEEESRFVRGQLDMAAQQRQPPGRANVFHIRHDVYTPNRIENRLLKTALEYVFRLCRHPDNWRLANELIHIMEPVESLKKPLLEFPKWTNQKILQPYQSVKPWCQLILEQLNPNFQKGNHKGIALMFPMERLFEIHVAACLARHTKSPWRLRPQPASQYLAIHQPQDTAKPSTWFMLQPDLLLKNANIQQVMDTKWKLINQTANTTERKYDLSQPDFYQLYAYGHKYQDGKGDMMLIYPRHSLFSTPLPCFNLDQGLRLWVVPFCIETDCLIPGEWQSAFHGLCDNNRQLIPKVQSWPKEQGAR